MQSTSRSAAQHASSHAHPNTDEDIDYADIPELDDSFFTRGTVAFPPAKKQLTIRLDEDILAWLKGQGRGYQTRINAILRA